MNIKCGIVESDYSSIHSWLRKQFGRACMCENLQCPGLSKYYHWAKRKGFDYQKKRENFHMLCASCHTKYDFTDNRRRLISESRMGKKNPKWAAFLKARKGRPHSEIQKQRIGNKVRGEQNGTVKLNERQVSVICHAMNFGANAHKLAPLFNISFSKVCQIFRGEAWVHVQAPRKQKAI